MLCLSFNSFNRTGRLALNAALKNNPASRIAIASAASAVHPKQVTICGGGNASHVFAALTPAILPDCKVHILTTFSDEAERWNNALSKNGSMTLTKSEPDGTNHVIKGSPALVTKDPKAAVPGSEVIFLPLPAFAHQDYLEAMAPYVSPGTTIVGLPMYPGFTWVLRKVFGPEKAATMKLVGGDTLPWAARLTEYGTSAEVIGTKSQMLGCSTDVATLAMPQACLGQWPALQHGSGICADLMTTNPYIHSAIMYAKWSRWDGKPLAEKPLFYQGADELAAETMSAMSNELVINTKNALKAMRPELNLDRVVHVHQWYIDCYKSKTEDSSTLMRCLNTNAGYRGLTHPCTETEDGKFMPDFTNRYMTEDLPMGLVPLRAIAHMAGLKTPVTDKVLEWCQGTIGKEYLKDGELNGKDIANTRAPVNFGITSIDQMIW